MIPDAASGKMNYANLKTKATRWDPPPGFGVDQANLNPGYDPQTRFQHNATNMNAQNQHNPQQQIWQQAGYSASASGRDLTQFGGQNGGNRMYQGHQVSAFQPAHDFGSQGQNFGFQNNQSNPQ